MTDQIIKTGTCTTYLPQRPLKEALEIIFSFTGKKYPKERGLETNGLENYVLLDFGAKRLVFTDFVSFLSFPIKQYQYPKDLYYCPFKKRYLIHTDLAEELKRYLYKNSKRLVKITSFQDNLTFSTDKRDIKANLLEDIFPDYKSFLEEGWENQVCFEFKKDSLIHLVETHPTSNGFIALNICKTVEGKLYLSEISGEKFSEGHYFNSYKGQYLYEELKIGLNYDYFLTALKKQESNTINIIIKDPSSLNKKCWNNSALLINGSMEVYLAPLNIN